MTSERWRELSPARDAGAARARRARRATRDRSGAARSKPDRAGERRLARSALHDAPRRQRADRRHDPRPHVLYQSRVARALEGRVLSSGDHVLGCARAGAAQRERLQCSPAGRDPPRARAHRGRPARRRTRSVHDDVDDDARIRAAHELRARRSLYLLRGHR